MKSTRISKGEIIADLRVLARALNHSPSSVEYKRLGGYDLRTVQRKFRLPWSQIINSAGLRYSSRTSGRIACTEELKRDLLRVARELDHPPTRAEYQACGQFDAETMRRRSGMTKWEDAVAALTGLDREEIKRQQARGGRYRTTQEWLSKLQALSRELGHAPTTRESNEAGINAHQLCLRVGGKWIDVLKAAHIDIGKRSKRAILLSTPTETLIADVVVVAKRLGRAPKACEYAAYGHHSYLALRGRFGGWRPVKKLVRQKLSVGQRDLSHSVPLEVAHSPLATQEAVKTFFTHSGQRSVVMDQPTNTIEQPRTYYAKRKATGLCDSSGLS